VDLDNVIPHAAVVLHHGGSGLFLRSVLGGASQIVFAMGADQPFTADRVRDLGLGQVLDPIAATPAAIAESVTGLQSDHQTISNVEALRRSTLALPEPATIVEQIEATI
jgi:UDP:flavonoid glycosyltransferase YjiC (YdhE family)